MTKLLTFDSYAAPLWLKAKPFLKRADVLLDIGAGIRPQSFVECGRQICLEAHGEYCDILRENGVETIQAEAPAGLARLDAGQIDTVTAFDVIEHLTREDGLLLIAEMVRLAGQQVVIFTPLGFMPQDGGSDVDPWGYQGQHWQAHRSGWTPEDFPGWRCFVDEKFNHGTSAGVCGAFFAIWDK